MSRVAIFYVGGGMARSMETFVNSSHCKHRPSMSFVEATRVLRIRVPAQTAVAFTPTYPDTSLPWSDDMSHNGYSARMFLHQLLTGFRPRWKPSDTERLLSAWMPPKLRGKVGNGISFVGAFNDPGCSSAECLRTPKMVRGVIRRALARGRSLRVLLHTGRDMIPVIVTFGKPEPTDSASWTATSEKPLPAYLKDGLMDFLRQHALGCAETPLSLQSQNGSDDELSPSVR